MAVFDLLDDKTISRIERHAAEAQAAPPAYLKYEPGIWKIGGEDFTNSEWLAIVDMTGIGWKLFIGSHVAEEHRCWCSKTKNQNGPIATPTGTSGNSASVDGVRIRGACNSACRCSMKNQARLPSSTPAQ